MNNSPSLDFIIHKSKGTPQSASETDGTWYIQANAFSPQGHSLMLKVYVFKYHNCFIGKSDSWKFDEKHPFPEQEEALLHMLFARQFPRRQRARADNPRNV